MTKSALMAVLVLPTIVVSNICADDDPPISRVSIQVTDRYGNRLRDARITLNGLSVALDSIGRDVVELKRGAYSVVVAVPGFATFQGTTTIDQPEQILSVGMRLGAYEGRQRLCSLKGRIDPVQQGVRVRLVSMFGVEVRDAPVKDSGLFQFEALECGSYMLLALQNTECVGSAFPVLTGRGVDVRLRLQKSSKGGIFRSAPGRTDRPETR